MSELIWVGNTLYPRGMVILFAAAVVLVPFMIGCMAIVAWRAWRRNRVIDRMIEDARRQRGDCRIQPADTEEVALLREIDATWPVTTSELRDRVRKVIVEAEPANVGQPEDKK